MEIFEKICKILFTFHKRYARIGNIEFVRTKNVKKVVVTMKHFSFSFLYAVMIGIVISLFSMGASTAGVSTVQAAEAQANVAVANEEAPLNENADNGGGAVMILLGGMLIIIIAVVITVVASVVTTAPIADEI